MKVAQFSYPKPGAVIRDMEGRHYKLVAQLNQGMQGAIYTSEDENILVKVRKPPDSSSADFHKHLRILIRRNLEVDEPIPLISKCGNLLLILRRVYLFMAGRFQGLSDLEWKLFEDIFPEEPSKRGKGMPHTPYRYVLNSLLYILITILSMV